MNLHLFVLGQSVYVDLIGIDLIRLCISRHNLQCQQGDVTGASGSSGVQVVHLVPWRLQLASGILVRSAVVTQLQVNSKMTLISQINPIYGSLTLTNWIGAFG